ncbi:MAG: hypothetical protein CSB47_05990 [Proteobacteria bacterium]|nr:MAG: hypothetical protein CSB47_05990 [Pseudomonadota bacterium]
MSGLLFILSLACLAWFWFDSIRAKETAAQAASSACQSIGAQLLDQTVALKSIRPIRNRQGRLQLERRFNFEFSLDRQERSSGRIILQAQRVTGIQLDSPDGTTIL